MMLTMSKKPNKSAKSESAKRLTHLDADGLPGMVDISAKTDSARTATACGEVHFPKGVAAQLRRDSMRVLKGGLVETAVLAGTQAVKRTSEWILLCHPLPIDSCRFEIDWKDERSLRITCTVKTVHRTGVEMEALTGVSAAALNIYDLCKALSHDIRIGPIELIEKRGGKSDVVSGRRTTQSKAKR